MYFIMSDFLMSTYTSVYVCLASLKGWQHIYIYILCYSNINWYQVEINIVLPLWTIYIDKSHNDETTFERNIHHCPCLRSLWWSYFIWVFWIYYGQDIFYTPLRQILYKNIRRKISCSDFQLNIEIYRQRFIYQQ